MRLHRIRVRDLKGIAERTLAFPDRGVVVVHGPNEIGKSTLLEAFDALLELPASSKSRRARGLQPAGRDVGPWVEAEFTVGGHRVRYAKRWLRQPVTELDVLTPSPEQLTGSEAQARMDTFIEESLDRTLWSALRLAQSGDGSIAPLVSSGSLRQALDAAAGADLHAEGGEQLLEAVEREYRTYFTATGRPTGDYLAAMRAYTRAQAEVADTHRRLTEADTLMSRLEAVRTEVAACTEGVQRARTELQGATEAYQQARGVVAAHEKALAALTVARERAEAARVAGDRRERDIRRLAALGEALDTARRGLAEQEHQAAVIAQQVLATAEALTEAEAAQERAERVVALTQATAERQRIQERLADVEDAEHRVQTLLHHAAAVRAAAPEHPVTQADLRRVEDLHREWEVLQARHEAASAVVRVESLGADVQVGAGSISPGAGYEAPLTDQLTVVVPGAVRVTIEPEASAQQRRDALAAAHRGLVEALTDCGLGEGAGLAELRVVADATVEHQARLRAVHGELDAVLSRYGREACEEARAGHLPRVLGQVREESTQALADLDLRLETLRHGEGAGSGWVDTGRSDRERPSPQQAEQALRQARQTCREARAAAAATRRDAQQITAGIDRATGALDADSAQREALAADLTEARAARPDEALSTARDQCAAELAGAMAEVQQSTAAVQAAGIEALRIRLQREEGASARAERALEQAREMLHTLSGQVEMAAGEGRQEVHDQALAELEEAERRLAGLDRRARAARHLRTALHEHRDAAHRAYVRPFTKELEELGRSVYGAGFAVEVDDELSLRRRTLHGVTVDFDDLSRGAREQLGILSRLAVARLVNPHQGGVPVIIDDALGYTDPERLQQMAEVLGASAQAADVQVILLTCTPERYQDIPGAHQVHLSA